MNTENKITLDKKYRYRSGEPARVLCVDAPGAWPVISINKDARIATHRHDGICGYTTHDLIEIREPRVIWVNEYRDGGIMAHASKESADYSACGVRISCRKFIEVIEEGGSDE